MSIGHFRVTRVAECVSHFGRTIHKYVRTRLTSPRPSAARTTNKSNAGEGERGEGQATRVDRGRQLDRSSARPSERSARILPHAKWKSKVDPSIIKWITLYESEGYLFT